MSVEIVLVGHEDARRRVVVALERGRLPAALLVVGETGLGKGTFAEWVVQASWCTGEAPPCGACGPCRKVASGNHPDLEAVRRGRDEVAGLGSAHGITVQQVREQIVAALALRPLEASGRAAIVHDADEMNVAAQNALLKTLEEPPHGSRLVLTTARPEGLLDTIRSRCQTLRLGPLDEVAMEAFAASHDEGVRRLARGRPGRLDALACLDLEGLFEAVDAALARAIPGTEFARRARELVKRAAEAGADHGFDEAALQRVALGVVHGRLREAAAQGNEALDAERLRRLDHAVLEAGEDVRRHLPAAVAWIALGLALAD